MAKKQYKKQVKRYRKKYMSGPTKSLGPLAVKLKAKLNYFEEFNLNPGVAGTPAAYVFSANGLYDPNISGVGHQPRGFDQLMTLYDHAVVIAMKATLRASNSDSTSTGANNVAMLFSDSTTTFGVPRDIQENRYVKTRVIAPTGSGNNTTVMSVKINPNKFLGRSKPLSDPDLKNSAGANPTEQCYLHCYGFPQAAGVDTGNIYASIQLEYTVIFIEPKQPSSS